MAMEEIRGKLPITAVETVEPSFAHCVFSSHGVSTAGCHQDEMSALDC